MKKLYTICGVLSALIALCALFLALQPLLVRQKMPVVSSTPVSSFTSSSQPVSRPVSSVPSVAPSTAPVESKTAAYVCPAELTAAMEQNADVYAWIKIPGTNVDFPVLQSETSDTLYLTRDWLGNYHSGGAIMSEHVYNTKTFADPVTLLYGHCMNSGAMFGQLQTVYSDQNNLTECGLIEIYMAEKKLEYQIFAAVPFDKRHILYNYDFSDESTYTAFFQYVRGLRAFNVNLLTENWPQYGDNVLILSTCLRGDSDSRYLVMARQKM